MKNSYIFFFTVLFLLPTIQGFSQNLIYNKGGTKSINYMEEIPYENRNGKIIIKVSINGINYNFLLDTGAPMMISRKILKEVNAEAVQHDQVTDVNGNKTSAQVVILNNLRVGNLTFNGLPAVAGLPDFLKCWNVDGIIGSNLLRNSIIRIDDRKKTLIITDLSENLKLASHTGVNLYLDTIQSYPSFEVQLSAHIRMPVHFDTGDNGLLSLSETEMQQLEKTKVYQPVSRGYGANQIGLFGLEKDNQKFLLKFPALNIDEVQLRNVTTITVKGSGARIGSKLLTYGVVTIDFIHRKFYFEDERKEIDLLEKHWPFQPIFSNNKMLVGLVWEAAGSSIMPGEQIVEIDGTSFETVDLCYLLNHQSILEGKESSTMTIKSAKGKLRKLEVKKISW